MRLQRIFATIGFVSMGTFVFLGNRLLSSSPSYYYYDGSDDAPSQKQGLPFPQRRRRDQTIMGQQRQAPQQAQAQQLRLAPKQKFPPQQQSAGIIFFIHLPKTGGTTIRDNFSNTTLFPRIHYVTVYSLKQFRAVQGLIEQRLSSMTMASSSNNNSKDSSRTVLFVEVHGHNTPTLMELEPILRQWKQRANDIAMAAQQQHDDVIPPPSPPLFFVFTLLREPLDLAVSFFNFFHVFGDKRFSPTPAIGTVDNLRRTLQWNPQCLYLVKGERPYFRPDLHYNVTAQDCDRVASLLFQHRHHHATSNDNNDNDDTTTTAVRVVDWVGDTQHLSTETLPLLVNMVTTTTTTSTTTTTTSGDAVVARTKAEHASGEQQVQLPFLHNNNTILQLLLSKMASSNVASTRRQRNRPLRKTELDARTIQEIRKVTQLDQKLYLQMLSTTTTTY